MRTTWKSWWLLVLVALLAAPAFAQKAEEEAGDVSEVDKDAVGPLRERIRPVSGHRLLMDGRFEVSPGVGISIRDAFFTKYVIGASLTYHFTETWAASARFGYGINVISGAAQICVPADPTATPPVSAGCRLPTREELTLSNGNPTNKAYGLITMLGSLDVQWSPIYGKFSVISEGFLGFNMYALAGPAVVMYGPTNSITVGGNAGLGFRFFINKWMTVRTELRDTIYYEVGVPTDSLRNQLMVELGFSMFFPTVFGEAR